MLAGWKLALLASGCKATTFPSTMLKQKHCCHTTNTCPIALTTLAIGRLKPLQSSGNMCSWFSRYRSLDLDLRSFDVPTAKKTALHQTDLDQMFQRRQNAGCNLHCQASVICLLAMPAVLMLLCLQRTCACARYTHVPASIKPPVSLFAAFSLPSLIESCQGISRF